MIIFQHRSIENIENIESILPPTPTSKISISGKATIVNISKKNSWEEKNKIINKPTQNTMYNIYKTQPPLSDFAKLSIIVLRYFLL